MLPSSKTIARNIGIFGGAQAFSVLAALIRTKVAAVFIGTTGVGVSAIYNSAVNFYSNIAGFGLSFSGVKYISEIYANGDGDALRSEVGKLRSLGLLGAAIGVALSVITAPLLSYIFFGGLSHMLHFAALSVFIAINILAGVEMAVLKSMQEVRALALSAIWMAITSIMASIPAYVLWGVDGVLWAVLISGSAGALVPLKYGYNALSLKETPLVSLFSYSNMARLVAGSKPLIVLGFAFLLGGVIASGAEMAIQAYLSSIASLSIVGLYKAGYQLSIYYTGMIFTAVNNDFYPRLSAVNGNTLERNVLISRQIRVLVCITTPLVFLFVLLIPYILPVLFDNTFNPVCGMVQVAAFSIIVKSVSMPLNFLPLSLGKSLDYLLLEGAFWIMLVPLVIIGYEIDGLDGIGMAILLCHIIELIYVLIFCRIKYDFVFYLRR